MASLTSGVASTNMETTDKCAAQVEDCCAANMGQCLNKSPKKTPGKGLQWKIDSWYQDLLDSTVKTCPENALKYAAIVTFPAATIIAIYPKNFNPDEKGVRDIIAALQGDTAGVAEDGVFLGQGCIMGVAGKLDANQAIYGTDGKDGGTDAFRSRDNLLIGSYTSMPTATTRLLRKTAQYMSDQEGKQAEEADTANEEKDE